MKISYLKLSVVLANELDWNTVVCKFEFQLHYYIHFQTKTLGKGNSFLCLSSGMGQVVPLLFFNIDGFGIE